MTRQKKNISYPFLLIMILFAVLPVACFKNLTVTNLVYENDFESSQLNNIEVFGWNNGLFGPVDQPRISNYNGSRVLGKLNNNQVKLNLTNLPLHQEIRVELSLLLHNTWKNDVWVMQFDGNNQLITGFSNDPAIPQSYPNWIGNGSSLSPAGANALSTYLPGICNLAANPKGSSHYQLVTTLRHSASSFTLSCNDAGGVFNDTCQRSWSIDNLKISILKN